MLSIPKYVLLIFFLSTGIIISGCGNNNHPDPPDDLIPEQKYIQLLAEMEVIKVYLEMEIDTTSAGEKMEYVFEQYGVTQDQFLRSNAYYEQHILEQQGRIEEASEWLSDEVND